MDVTTAGPFNRVACPNCQAEVRVKVDLGNYFLKKRLAFGGMSVLFVAEDQTLGREVALKVLNEEYSSDEVRTTQFEKEAELTALVSHPNVVRVYSVGRAFDRFYIAMELIAGESLEKRLESGKGMPEKEVLQIALQVTSGLKAAKASGLIHRDIKPGNILVDLDGTAKIVDFGLSLVTQAGSAQAKEVFATPYYAPPEALEAGVEDFRSDIYALGASLYHALAGEAPIETTSTNTKVLLDAKLQTPALRMVAAHISQSTSDLVSKMMSFQKEARPASYDEVTAGLQRALEGQEQSWKEAGASSSQSGGNVSFAWVAALVATVLLVMGYFVLQGRKEAGQSKDEGSSTALARTSAPPEEMKITRLYEQAREALGEGRLDEAELNFLRLHRLKDVPEPTGTWAGFEAGLCALLDGRSGDARAIFTGLESRIESAGLSGETMVNLEALLAEWDDIRAFELLEESPRDPESALAEFARLLKNWEQGEREVQPFLNSFVKAKFSSREEWVKLYQDWGEKLAADASLLEVGEPDWDKEWSSRELDEELRTLASVAKSLQTFGRARFTVKSWQDWLKSLETKKSKPVWEQDS